MVAVRNEGKTAFVKDVLTKSSDANHTAVNEAWTAAGRRGSISPSLWQKVRAEMKLAGNRPRGRKPTGGKDATAPKRAVGRPPAKTNGRHDPEAREARTRPRTDDRTRMLTKVEADIDEMIFQVKAVGGLHEFEETLRKARRILARSHGE